MQTGSRQSTFLIVATFVLVAGLLRLLLSEVPNIAPVAAMALFGGAYFRNRKMALILPLLVMFFTDVALEIAFQAGWREFSGIHAAMPYVYISFLLVVLIGMSLRSNVKPLPLFAGGLLSAVVFFIITNFGVWMTGGYPATFEGLIACYTAAIPFFRYTIVGDLFFIGVFFGAFELVKHRFLVPVAA